MSDGKTSTHTVEVVRLLAAASLLGPLLAVACGALLAWHPGAVSPAAAGLAIAAFGIAGAVACAISFVVLRTLRGDVPLMERLRQEAERREAAEAALRQLQKMDAVGRLTRGIAHDFNNHLTAISSNIELLARRLPKDSEPLARLTDAAMQGVRRAAALTHRLLAFSRQQAPDPEPLDIGRLVGSMAELLRRTLGESVTVRTITPDGLWLAWADANQLEAALLHLAVNARENMPDGGTLTIEAANVSAGDQPGNAPCVMLAVSDTGRNGGDHPALDATPLPDSDRLGLSMVYGFARQFQGEVRLFGTADGGSSVRLYLPRYAPAPVLQEAVERPAGGSETILVVEDEDSVRQASAAALRDMGYEVLEAPDAMEGFRLIADRGGVDLLFTDLGLPGGVDGKALADAARNVSPELKVLFTTGYRLGAAGTDPVAGAGAMLLPKPFTFDQLAAKVREALGAAETADVVEVASGD